MSKESFNTPLFCGIDTFSIISDVFVNNGDYAGVSQLKARKINTDGEMEYTLKINPNTYNNDVKIKTYNEFEQVRACIENDIGITESRLTRTDINLDSYDDNYDEKLKINKLLLLLIADISGIKNRYQSLDPLTLDNLTIRIQNDYFEVEYYNKSLQSNFTDEATTRLEFRSKALSKFGNQKTIPELVPYWKNKLDNAIADYKPLLMKCNEILIKKWNEEKDLNTKTFSEFIRKYQENIFSSKQLIDLFHRIGVKNPKQSAYRFKKDNGIEYISQNDLKFYVKIINQSISNFMDN